MTEKEAMFRRHSVRIYQDKKIEESKIILINEKIAEINREGDLNIHFSEDSGKTFRSFLSRMSGLGSAPSAIICAGKDSEDLEQRVGYYGEKLVLYLQQLGLNTCWVGMFSKKQAELLVAPETGERTVIAIAVGYGVNQGKERKTKTPAEVWAGPDEKPDWFVEGVNAALLAPTAINQQKFTIRLNEDETVDFIDNGGVFSQVDLGIEKYHFEVGSGRKMNLWGRG